MVSRAKRLRKKNASKSNRGMRAAAKKAKGQAELEKTITRAQRLGAIKTFGKRAAAALVVTAVFAIGMNGGSTNPDKFKGNIDSGKGKVETSIKAEPQEKSGEMDAIVSLSVFTNRMVYDRGASGTPTVFPAEINGMQAGRESTGSKTYQGESENKTCGYGNREGNAPTNTERENPERERRKPWRVDWDNLWGLPVNPRRKFELDPLNPEDERNKE